MPVLPQTPPPEQGLLGAGGGGLPSSILTWVAPSPTAWQLGPQPHRTASPCLLGSTLPPTRTAFPVHLSELLGCEADPVPSLLRLSPGLRGRPPPTPSPSSFKPILVSNQRASGPALVPPGPGRSQGLSWPRPGLHETGKTRGSRPLPEGGLSDPWWSHLPALSPWPATPTCPYAELQAEGISASLGFSVWSWGALDSDVIQLSKLLQHGPLGPPGAAVKGGTIGRGSRKCCLFMFCLFPFPCLISLHRGHSRF